MTFEIVKDEHGLWMQVIRPDNPARALALAKQSVALQQSDLFDAVPLAAGCLYTYLGYFGKQGKQFRVVDAEGAVLGELEKGDSFVTGFTCDVGARIEFGPNGRWREVPDS